MEPYFGFIQLILTELNKLDILILIIFHMIWILTFIQFHMNFNFYQNYQNFIKKYYNQKLKK